MNKQLFKKIVQLLETKDHGTKAKIFEINFMSWDINLKQLDYLEFITGITKLTTYKHICCECSEVLTDTQVKFGSYSRFNEKAYSKSYAKPYCDECIKSIVYGSGDGFWFGINELKEEIKT